MGIEKIRTCNSLVGLHDSLVPTSVWGISKAFSISVPVPSKVRLTTNL